MDKKNELMGFMPIETVLYHIRTSGGVPFMLKYFSKKSGEFVIKRCLYRAVASEGVVTSDGEVGGYGKFTLAGTMPLTDVDGNKPITPKIAHIVQYNNHLVKH